jgi:hypothetical protein
MLTRRFAVETAQVDLMDVTIVVAHGEYAMRMSEYCPIVRPAIGLS